MKLSSPNHLGCLKRLPIIPASLLFALLACHFGIAQDADPRRGEDAAAAARPFVGLFGTSDSDAFRKAVSGLSDFRVYEGLPDPRADPRRFETEARRPDLLKLGKGLFYPTAVPITASESQQLQKIFNPGNPFSPGGGGDPCGTFHPDYALVWGSGANQYSALIGLGCQEIHAIGPSLEIHRYIPPPAYAEFDRLLGGRAGPRASNLAPAPTGRTEQVSEPSKAAGS